MATELKLPELAESMTSAAVTAWLKKPGDRVSAGDPIVEVDTDTETVAGRGVAVHCRAGIGRSGMVALRLMIEAGEAPDDALARLRTVRPCAVETTAQMHWAMSAPRQAALFLRRGD